MGFGARGSSGSSESQREADFPAIQKPFLTDIWEQAQGVEAGGVGSSEAALNAVNQFLPQAQQATAMGRGVGTGIAAGATPGQQLALGSGAGLFGLGQQGQTNQLINQVGQDISTDLFENVLPGLRSQEIGVGALGGSRGEILSGLATQGAQRAFATQAAGIRQNDLFRRQGALESAARAGGQFTQFQGLGAELAQDSAQNLLDLGLAPSRAFWAPLQNYASLVNGSPQIGQFGTSSSRNRSFGFSVGAQS
jgi:hypothetical protein